MSTPTKGDKTISHKREISHNKEISHTINVNDDYERRRLFTSYLADIIRQIYKYKQT